LVGSGEYTYAMKSFEEGLLDGRPPRWVQIPTAATPDGAETLDKWVEMGVMQARRLGVTAVPLRVETREQADDPAIAEQVRDAGLIYLSGGSPQFLADTLRDTLLSREIVAAWRAGASLAGCSAGAIALTDWVPDLRNAGVPPHRGLGVVPHLRVIPHFDRIVQWLPDLPERYVTDLPPEDSVVGIDEDTAMVGGPNNWLVQGTGSVWLISASGREEVPTGSVFVTGA
jgi:cyanophycinase-like exopeptidase